MAKQPSKIRNTPGGSPELRVCTPRRLHPDFWVKAAQRAIEIEPRNYGRVQRMIRLDPKMEPTPQRIALLTDRKWPVSGVTLSVGFLDNPDSALRKRILEHMNAWSRTANVHFTESNSEAQVRIAREGGANGGYWSYLGTEILEIPPDEQTMNLEGFTMQTPDSEFHRVVRHETGHTLGFPHEHMRRELVEKIDPQKAIEYFGQTQGWSPEEVRQQVLTPLEDSSLLETAHADPRSIMCYQIPGSVTKNGKPILGGLDIDAKDYSFAGKVYPKPVHHGLHAASVADAADSAVIEISGGEITRITLKRPTAAQSAPA